MNKLELIEYVRKSNRKPKRDENGHIIVKNNGRGRQKKGVLYCGLNPNDDNKVVIGFSLCNSIDQFDYINGQCSPGFGLELARIRAKKWAEYNGYFVQNTFTQEEIEEEGLFLYKNPIPDKDDPDAIRLVEVPPSIIKNLSNFIQRCKRYYSKKKFPEWIEGIEKGDDQAANLERIYYSGEDYF